MMQRQITTSSGTVHYWVGGEETGGGVGGKAGRGAQPILFTHGATMDHGMFDAQVRHFGQSRRVLTWDVPCHGASRPCREFSLRRAAADLVSILDAERIERVNLVGQSMGGYIAQIVALEHPGRVNSLCAVDSSPLDLDYYSGLDKWLLSITPALLKLYPYKTLVRTIAKQISVSDAGRAYALRTLEGLTKGEIASIMAAVYGGLVEYGRENVVLPCPVLLVVGERDETGKVIRYCRAWAEKEGLPLQTVPDAAHNSNVDNPRAFNDILEGFLEGR